MSVQSPEVSAAEPGGPPRAETSGDTSTTTEAGGTDPAKKDSDRPLFILYLEGAEYARTLRQLTLWTHHVLLPVYGREVTSTAPWCARWWEHPEAVAQLHGLWLAWGELTGPGSGMCGPANWHRDYLNHVMNALRDPSGPFAGCKPGAHRRKEPPKVDMVDPFGPPPTSA
ncbi:DUF4913 domain-containing protein [Streptomyces sp. NPDC047061]|uniref:DUF4913 domain-containing protein n=1 Tax=Streptomyces sp. NPDC047061 TaxID=3154605 RepID=UPI0033D6C670